jgi:hypothetical protein
MSVLQSIGPSRLLEYVKSTSDYDEDDNGNLLAIAVAPRELLTIFIRKELIIHNAL